MKLPDTLTPEQIKSVVQKAIRIDLERDAVVSSVEVKEASIHADYTSEGRAFEAIYRAGSWTKGPTDAKTAVDFTEDNFAEDEEADSIEPWMSELRESAGEFTDRWVGQVKELLDESGDLASFSERLLTVYPDLDGERLRSVMADAMTAASIAGSQEDEHV